MFLVVVLSYIKCLTLLIDYFICLCGNISDFYVIYVYIYPLPTSNKVKITGINSQVKIWETPPTACKKSIWESPTVKLSALSICHDTERCSSNWDGYTNSLVLKVCQKMHLNMCHTQCGPKTSKHLSTYLTKHVSSPVSQKYLKANIKGNKLAWILFWYLPRMGVLLGMAFHCSNSSNSDL